MMLEVEEQTLEVEETMLEVEKETLLLPVKTLAIQQVMQECPDETREVEQVTR
jgi:hypothetical protein